MAQTFETLHRQVQEKLRQRPHKGQSDSSVCYREAAYLLVAASGYERAELVMRAHEAVPDAVCQKLDDFLERRLSGEPLFRILGCREFHGLPLRLSPHTLEPRDDTEALVELVLAHIDDEQIACRFADLGTGTGAVGLALLSELPKAHAILTDMCPHALQIARDNADLLSYQSRCSFSTGDWCDALAPHLTGQLDFVVSNPPYIATDVINQLASDVTDYDPKIALDGGQDGLEAYRALLQSIPQFLKKNGFLALEIGFDQRDKLVDLAGQFGWAVTDERRDLNGCDRALLLRRRP